MTNITDRNKINAQFSTGPTSDAGKARSSQNALKTGLYSSSALLPTEDAEQFRRHNESYVLEYNPQGATQRDLVQSISDDAWCMFRIRKLVAAQHARLARFDAPDAEPCKMEHKLAQLRALEILSRHEQRTKNAGEKTIKLLKELQKQAKQVPSAPKEKAPSKPASGFVPNSEIAVATAAVFTPENTENPVATAPSDAENLAA